MSFHDSELARTISEQKLTIIFQIPVNFFREFSNSREFPPGIFGIANSPEFQGIPERELPVALQVMQCTKCKFCCSSRQSKVTLF